MKAQVICNILDSPITVLDFILLESISNGTFEEFESIDKFYTHLQFLKSEEYVSNNNKLTLKGREILTDLNKIDEKLDFYGQIHKSLQEELLNLTGKKQKMLQNKYGFIPTASDLKLRLQKVIKKYNLEDEKKVKEVLLSYVKRCVKARFEYVQTIGYYILKDGMSNFATDYENYADTKQDEQDEFTGINV